MSSTTYGATPDLATDGLVEAIWGVPGARFRCSLYALRGAGPAICAHSMLENNPWITIDLGTISSIYTVLLQNRGDSVAVQCFALSPPFIAWRLGRWALNDEKN